MLSTSRVCQRQENIDQGTKIDVDQNNEELIEAQSHQGAIGDKASPEYTEFSNPLYLLKTSLEDRVTILLQNDSFVTGLLASFDEHMNILLINAEEMGRPLNRFFPLLFVRGDSIIFVTRRRITNIA